MRNCVSFQVVHCQDLKVKSPDWWPYISLLTKPMLYELGSNANNVHQLIMIIEFLITCLIDNLQTVQRTYTFKSLGYWNALAGEWYFRKKYNLSSVCKFSFSLKKRVAFESIEFKFFKNNIEQCFPIILSGCSLHAETRIQGRGNDIKRCSETSCQSARQDIRYYKTYTRQRLVYKLNKKRLNDSPETQ